MPPKSLLELAREKFGELSEAEVKLFEATEEGELAVVSVPGEGTDLSKADLPVIKADRLVWLMTDKRARRRSLQQGLNILGARINGILDLSTVDWPWRFGLLLCYVPDGISLQDASFGMINFTGAHTGSVIADRVCVKKSVFLRNNFSAKGNVHFHGAEVGADFDCIKGKFDNKDKGYALSCDGINVRGCVMLSGGFKAKGETRFVGASIGGNFDCSQGTFRNKKGYALNADGVKVKRNVFLRNGCSAKGDVRLLGADIRNTLDCSNGIFRKSKKYTLNADGIKVGGGVFLNNGFTSNGEVCFLGAVIGGAFDCSNGIYRNNNWHALGAERIKVNGSVFLRGFSLQGVATFQLAEIGGGIAMNGVTWNELASLDLRHATIRTLYDDTDWPRKGKLLLDGFTYEAISDESSLVINERLKWLDRQPDDQFHPQPYEQLAKVLSQSGHEQAAKEVLIAKNDKLRYYLDGKSNLESKRWRFMRKFISAPEVETFAYFEALNQGLKYEGKLPQLHWVSRFWLWLIKWVTGYGYKPWRVIWYMIAAVSLGALFFAWGDQDGAMTNSVAYYIYAADVYAKIKPTPGTESFRNEHQADSSLRHIMADDYPPFNAILYSMDTFLPLVDFNQQSYWMPNANTRLGWHLRWYLMVHILAGWVLTSILVAAFAGFLKR